MSARIWFSPEARGQARDAAIWWRDNRPKAPRLLARELEHYLELLSDTPGLGRSFEHSDIPNLMCVLLPRTKYDIYYVHHVDRAEIEVVAFWGAVRGRTPLS